MKTSGTYRPATLKNKLILIALLLAVGGGAWVISAFTPYALTDHHISGERSGLIIYTDFYTGCQYLGTVSGGLTERRRPSGKHMCLTRNAY